MGDAPRTRSAGRESVVDEVETSNAPSRLSDMVTCAVCRPTPAGTTVAFMLLRAVPALIEAEDVVQVRRVLPLPLTTQLQPVPLAAEKDSPEGNEASTMGLLLVAPPVGSTEALRVRP